MTEGGASTPDEKTAPIFPETPETEIDQPADFKTPDQVAAADDVQKVPQSDDKAPQAQSDGAPETAPEGAAVPKITEKTSWKDRLALHWPPRKKEYIVAAFVLMLL